ncbi:AbrB/MazE/SpoVT family DNA-binding domain-containing protein [Synergistes jonesii]|uniref:AbrB/MazE/SpoVT family DNA-binding domain-containing protein n=1 Tax=Synergistes jonesii TaxID=2754 RepID=UPI00248F06BF|nr:AbrB/MazE/SpoVT family DNA-binding domain-containing protein [Synergistes jonesii]
MIELATVSAKGQITIPKSVREEFDIKPGDRVFFIKSGEGLLISKPPKNLLDYKGFLKDRAPASAEEAWALFARNIMGEA